MLRPHRTGRFGVCTSGLLSNRWEIIVQPVPRSVRHRIKQYILGSALPQIADWLSDRSQLAQQGSDMLTFFYDEKTEEFTARPLTSLEPLRGK